MNQSWMMKSDQLQNRRYLDLVKFSGLVLQQLFISLDAPNLNLLHRRVDPVHVTSFSFFFIVWSQFVFESFLLYRCVHQACYEYYSFLAIPISSQDQERQLSLRLRRQTVYCGRANPRCCSLWRNLIHFESNERSCLVSLQEIQFNF